MIKVFLFFTFLLTLSFACFAQSDDIRKFEIYGGYTNQQVETGISNNSTTTGTFSNSGGNLRSFFDRREGFNGFEISGVRNFSRFIGAKGTYSATFKDFDFAVPNSATTTNTTNFRASSSVQNFLGGVQVKDNAVEGSRLRPFGYAMLGAARGRTRLGSSAFSSAFCLQAGVNCTRDFSNPDTGFAAAFGGGMDIKATNRFSIRAFQIDYNPTHINGFTQDNVRFGVGVVIH